MREHIPGMIWITWSFSCHRNYAQKCLHAVTVASVTRHGWKYHSSQRCSNDHARVSLFIKTEEASPLWGRRASSNFSSSAALAVSHMWKGNTVKYPRPNLPMSWGAAPPAAPAHLEHGTRLCMNSRLSAPGPGSPAAAQTCSLMHTRGCFGQNYLKLCFLRNDWARSLCAKQVLAGFSECSSLTVTQMGGKAGFRCIAYPLLHFVVLQIH